MSGSDHIESAIGHVETALGKTLRGDAVGAGRWAIEILTSGPDSEDIQQAKEILENHRAGAVGDAVYDFDDAIDELNAVAVTDPDPEAPQ